MYLVDTQEREHEAIRRLLELIPNSSGFFESLGLDPLFSWYLIEIRTDLHFGLLPTDVDILAGRLNWRDPKAFQSILAKEVKSKPNTHPSININVAALKLAGSGGIIWPPLTDYLIGIEAKCGYLDPKTDKDKPTENDIKSKKSSKEAVYKIQNQVKKLLSMGFNKVALLDIIANPPASGIDGQAFVKAANTATASTEAMLPILRQRLPNDSLAGHWVWSIGSVIGGNETIRGAGVPIELQKASENNLNTNGKTNRGKMEITLNKIFGKLTPPYNFPVIFVDCRACRTIHRLGDTCDSG